jgi:hypothetical protein
MKARKRVVFNYKRTDLQVASPELDPRLGCSKGRCEAQLLASDDIVLVHVLGRSKFHLYATVANLGRSCPDPLASGLRDDDRFEQQVLSSGDYEKLDEGRG